MKDKTKRSNIPGRKPLPDVKKILTVEVYDNLKKDNIKLSTIRFLAEYLTNGNNGTRAYQSQVRRNANDNVAGLMASKILSRDKIKEVLVLLLNKFLEEKKIILRKQIIEVLTEQAFYNPTDIINNNGELIVENLKDLPENLQRVIEGIEVKYHGKDATRKTTTVKLTDRHKSIEKLMRYLEMINEQVNVKMNKAAEDRLKDIFGDGKKKKLPYIEKAKKEEKAS